jgi:pimeloyl-ACP methyl ester carboxylesterase
MWEPQIGPLSDRFTVVTYDVRGFGLSPLAPGRHSDRADLQALIDALELERPHLVGVSMGAGIIWDAVLAYPGLARSLVVVPGGIDGDAMPAWMDVVWPKLEAAIDAGDFQRATELVTDPDLPPLQSIRHHPDVLGHLTAIISEHPWAAWSAKWPAHDWLDPPAYSRMGELDVPVLAISGALDAPEFRAESEYIARTAPHAEHLEIPNASHFVNMEAPAGV